MSFDFTTTIFGQSELVQHFSGATFDEERAVPAIEALGNRLAG